MSGFSRSVAMIIAALWVSLAVAQIPPEASRGIIVEMPHGWWRIHIRPDGSGILNFAALPQTGRFPEGTFDFAEVTERLRKESSAERDVLSPSQGTIRFFNGEGGGVRWYFDNWNLADDLFEEAWHSRLEPRNEVEREHLETLARLWARREPPFLPNAPEVTSPLEKTGVIAPPVRTACAEISGAIRKILGAPPEKSEGRVRDPARGDEYLGCRLFTTFPVSLRGENFDLGGKIRKELRACGWQESPRYAADGPGTISYALGCSASSREGLHLLGKGMRSSPPTCTNSR